MSLSSLPLPSGPREAPVPALAPSDDELVRRICGRDPVAFELLMRRHNRRLYRIARSLLRDAAEAEDALQEAYLAAYRAMPAFRAQASVATWLARIVANECMGRLRRGARRARVVPIVTQADLREDEAPPPDAPDADTPDRQLARTQLRVLLERSIDRLPEEFRTVFVLRSVEELSVEETAACLDIPEGTVRTRHFRARSLLRAALSRDLSLAEREVFDFLGERCDRIVAAVLARWRGS